MNVLRACVAVLCAALVSPPVAVAAPVPALTITGTRNSYAYLTVTETIRYDLRKATVDHLSGRSGADAGRGRYGGFAIGRDDPTLWTIHDLEFPASFGTSRTRGVLKPGRYTIHLFADGDTVTARIPWTGPDVVLEPDAPLDARVHIGTTAVPSAESPPAVVIPQDGRRGAVTTAAVKLDAVVGPSMVLRTCLTRTATSCRRAPVDVVFDASGTALNGYMFGWTDHHWPTAGMFVRGEVSGNVVGRLTLVTLRYYHPRCGRTYRATPCASRA